MALRDGSNTVTAVAGDLSDTISLHAVAEPNPDYVLPGFGPSAQVIFGPMAKSMKNMYSTGMMSKTTLENILKMSGSGLGEKGKLYLNLQLNQIKK